MDRIGSTLPWTSTVRTGARGLSACSNLSPNRKARSPQYFSHPALVFVFGILQVSLSKSQCPWSQMMGRIGNTLPWTSAVRKGARGLLACSILSSTERHAHRNLSASWFGVCLRYSPGATIEVAVPLVANDGQDKRYIATDINGTAGDFYPPFGALLRLLPRPLTHSTPISANTPTPALTPTPAPTPDPTPMNSPSCAMACHAFTCHIMAWHAMRVRRGAVAPPTWQGMRGRCWGSLPPSAPDSPYTPCLLYAYVVC
jgi:hypothetical protein